MAMDISGLNKAVVNTQKNLENAKKVNIENFNKISMDITNIDSEISKFNSYLQFESVEYPGCFYRIIDKEVEWVNPPMIIGVEYRTTERFNGKPVYVKLLVTNTLPSKGEWVGIDLGTNNASIIECKGRLRVKNDNATKAFPNYRLVVNGIGYAVLVGETNFVQIYSTADLSRFGEAEILVKYTRRSDQLLSVL